MDRGQCGRAQQILAWCKALQGDHGAAAGDFCAALPNLQETSGEVRWDWGKCDGCLALSGGGGSLFILKHFLPCFR